MDTITDFTSSRPSGTYTAINPTGLLAGTYVIDIIDGKDADGMHMAVWRAYNSTTGVGYIRNERGGAFTSWRAVWGRQVVEDGAAVVLTPAQSGALCIFDKTDGALFTLPVPEIGLYYDFSVDTVRSTNSHKVITDAGTTFIQGTVLQMTLADAANVADAANGSSHISVTMNGTTTGGIAGTRFRLTCRTLTKWEIEGLIIASGSVASSFAAT